MLFEESEDTAKLVECLPSIMIPDLESEVQAGGSEVLSYLWIHRKFKVTWLQETLSQEKKIKFCCTELTMWSKQFEY